MTKIPRDLAEDLDDLLSRAFEEDGEDVTSLAVFGPTARLSARIVCRERAVVAGAAFLPRLFAFLSPPARVTVRVPDGALVAPGTTLAEIEGPAITVLAAERTALNLLQRLSGIATKTREYVDALKGTKAVLLDTRKTTAGLRRVERYAVRCGGGTNHRYGLAWGFLVKDNHADGAGSVWEATRRAKDFRALNKRLAPLLLEAEARTRDEVHQALDAGAERDPPRQHVLRGDGRGGRGRRPLQRGDRRARDDRGLRKDDARDGAGGRRGGRRFRVRGSDHALHPRRRHRPRRRHDRPEEEEDEGDFFEGKERAARGAAPMRRLAAAPHAPSKKAEVSSSSFLAFS